MKIAERGQCQFVPKLAHWGSHCESLVCSIVDISLEFVGRFVSMVAPLVIKTI